MSDVGWLGHRWLEVHPRAFRVGAGTLVRHRRCVQCGRDFLFDQSSGGIHAVFVSGISFHLLDAAVTAGWVTESCPGKHLPSDDEDRKRSIAELFVSEELEKPRVKHR